MLSLKNSLKVLKKTKALLDGHFVLSSGLHSAQYVQCAWLLSQPRISNKFVSSLAAKIKKEIKKYFSKWFSLNPNPKYLLVNLNNNEFYENACYLVKNIRIIEEFLNNNNMWSMIKLHIVNIII